MKKSIKAIAAMAAALTMTFSCVPRIYAADEAPAVQTEEESAAKLEFTEGRAIDAPYNGVAAVSDGEGNVYYSGHDRENRRPIIYTLDENGDIKNSYIIYSYVNDKGESIGAANLDVKQCGNYICLIYSEACGFSIRESVIIKLDKELNEISKNKFPKSKCIDTDGEKVVYLKGDTRIYICDMDGENSRLLYTANKSGVFEQPMNSVAVAGNYVGFQKRTGYPSAPDYKQYCGLIDINTGEVTLHEQRDVEQVFSQNGNLIWYGEQGYYVDDGADAPFGDAEAMDAYFKSHYKYYDKNEFYIFDGKDYSVFTPPHENDTYFPTAIAIDNEGNITTVSYKNNGSKVFRIYRDGKLIGEHTVNYKGYCGFAANNGVMTICYDGKDGSADDWVGFDPETTTPEELQAMLDETPAAKAKDSMKSVTISYR